MKKCLILILIITFWGKISSAISPQEILQKTDFVRAPFESFITDIELISPDKTMQLKVYSKKETRVKSLAVYLLPKKEKGKLLLMKEEDLWIYIPGTRRALRITPMQRLMGGVSNGDITRLRWSMDYDAKLIDEDENMYKMELTAITKNATYYRLLLSIEKVSFKPIKAKVYLKSEKLYKTISFTGFKTFSGKIMATNLTFIDHLKADKETLMTFSNVENKEVPNNYFNRTAMPRLSDILSGR